MPRKKKEDPVYEQISLFSKNEEQEYRIGPISEMWMEYMSRFDRKDPGKEPICTETDSTEQITEK